MSDWRSNPPKVWTCPCPSPPSHNKCYRPQLPRVMARTTSVRLYVFWKIWLVSRSKDSPFGPPSYGLKDPRRTAYVWTHACSINLIRDFYEFWLKILHFEIQKTVAIFQKVYYL